MRVAIQPTASSFELCARRGHRVAMGLYHMWMIAVRRRRKRCSSAARTCCSRWCWCSCIYRFAPSRKTWRCRCRGRAKRRPQSGRRLDRLCLLVVRRRCRSSISSSTTNTSSTASIYIDDLIAGRHGHGHVLMTVMVLEGDAPRDRLGAADHGAGLPGLRAVHRPARAGAPARSALHDHRGHLRHPARRSRPSLRDDLRAVRLVHGAHRHRPAVHGFRAVAHRPHRRRARQGRRS